MTKEELQKLAEEESRKRGLDPALTFAMIDQESGWNPKATSGAGAQGLMQLMPGTAKDLGVSDPYDPQENIRGGLDYLKQLSEEFKTPEMKLAAYNAGPGNVRSANGVPDFPETKGYVSSVLDKAKGYGFNPGDPSIEAKDKLMGPDFGSLMKSDALGGDEVLPVVGEPKQESGFGKIFGSSRGPSTIDQYGNRKPGEYKEGVGRKILSAVAPLLFGLFPNPFMGALAGVIQNSQIGSMAKAKREDDEYQKLLEESMKAAQPSDDLKKFREWEKLSDDDRAQYKDLKAASNPYALGNLDLGRQRLDLERQKQQESLIEKDKDRQAKAAADKAGQRLPAAQSTLLAEGKQIPQVLAYLEKTFADPKNAAKTGPLSGLSRFNPYDTPAQIVQSQVNTAKQLVGKFIEGGVLRKEDESKYDRIMPTMQDTPEVRAAKLANIKRMVEEKYNSYLESYANSGYDVSKYSSFKQDNPTGGVSGGATHRINPATGKIEPIQ